MTVSAAPLEAVIDAHVDSALGAAAGFLATKLFEILSVQAPVGEFGGRIYAMVPASPGAPPRRVTGNLQSHVGFDRLGPGEWVAGIRQGVDYATTLEYVLDHAFVSVVVEENMDELGAVMAAQIAGGA